jgi:Arc/MetJ-type ribon-helix-helix transcriptional regulator
MTIHLPEELERYVRSAVASGHFASEDEAIADAVRAWVLRRTGKSAAPTPLTEDQLEQQLTQTGLLALPSRQAAAPSHSVFPPIPIQGEPLSETVIRERR